VSYLYLLIVPAAALLGLVLWYALVLGWAVVLGRMAQSVSTWDELEEDDGGGRKSVSGQLVELGRLLRSRCACRAETRARPRVVFPALCDRPRQRTQLSKNAS